MSNTYNQEPQAYGHIKFKTTFGDLDIELFTKQCPKVTRNFTQLCLDGYYKHTIFERVEKDFIAIGGCKSNQNDDDDDDDEYFPDEFHSRLRFTRRGLLATANTNKNQNGSRFFFTLGSTPELQNKHTIFGRLKGNTVYTLVDLNECQVDEDFTPYSEQRITDVIIIENPYPELVPRVYKQNYPDHNNADSSESEVDNPLAGPKVEPTSKKLIYHDDDSDDDNSEHEVEQNIIINDKSNDEKPIKETLDDKLEKKIVQNNEESSHLILDSEAKNLAVCESSPKQLNDANAKEEKLRQIKAQIEALREQIESQTETKTLKQRSIDRSNNKSNEVDNTSINQNTSSNDYEQPKKKIKNKERERETLELVSNFRKRLKDASKETTKKTVKELEKSKNELDDFELELAGLDRLDGDAWLKHEFNPKDNNESDLRMGKESDVKDDDWYKVEDSRKRKHHSYDRHERHRSDRNSSYHPHASSRHKR